MRIVTIHKTALFASFLLAGYPVLAQEHCMRSEPEPLFLTVTPFFLTHSFIPISKSEANELIEFKTGELLRITHTGCEYYTIIFRFESNSPLTSSLSPVEAFRKAAKVLRTLNRLKPNLACRLDLAAKTLEKAQNVKPGPFFSIEYPVAGDGVDFLQTRVVVSSAERLGDREIIEFSLSKGPL
jgi:hypothetical protein